MSFRFERLQVWQEGRVFVGKIYKITGEFPKKEIFGIIDQLKRAAVSIILNIAEGSDKKSDKEFVRYLRTAIASTEEVVTALYIALDQKYISKEIFDELYNDANKLVAKLNALINSIKKH